jgi:hypothetical protein
MTSSRIAACVLILCAGFAFAAAAQDSPADSPPKDPPPANPLPDNPLPGSAPAAKDIPAADAAAAGLQVCLKETGDYVSHGSSVSYVIGLTNTCDKRLKCKIYAYVVGARGPSSGEATLVLGAKSSGAAARKTYTMKVKAAGGIAQVSRECREF